jgi:outer membrane protein
VTLPLFEGFRTTYRAARARAELARAAAEEQALLKGVELEVWTEYSRAAEAAEAVEAARKFKGAADEASRVAEGMYRAGAGSIIEMVDSLAARTAAGTRLVQSGLELHSARARLERAVGRMRGAGR